MMQRAVCPRRIFLIRKNGYWGKILINLMTKTTIVCVCAKKNYLFEYLFWKNHIDGTFYKTVHHIMVRHSAFGCGMVCMSLLCETNGWMDGWMDGRMVVKTFNVLLNLILIISEPAQYSE